MVRMDKLKKALTWLKVVLTSAPTVIVAVTVAVGLVAQSLVDVLPDQYDGKVTKVAAWVVLALTGLANIVRRVTPVVESARGVLPKGE